MVPDNCKLDNIYTGRSLELSLLCKITCDHFSYAAAGFFYRLKENIYIYVKDEWPLDRCY